MQNLSYENEFDLHENEPVAVGGTPLYMNGFARKLVLTKKQKATRKCPIFVVVKISFLVF